MQFSEYQIANDLRSGQLVEVLSAYNIWKLDAISNGHCCRRQPRPHIRMFMNLQTTIFVGHRY